MIDHIQFDDHGLKLLDQRVLPNEVRWVHCTTATQTATAITDMVVRGAPAIGVTAAYGMALAARGHADLQQAANILRVARPTAVNLAWAVDAMLGLPANQIEAAARKLHQDDIASCRRIGETGADVLPENAAVVTHCNAGALATGGWGTALGVLRSAHQRGQLKMVYAGETRPYLQGARLTAYECQQDGLPVTLMTDNAMGYLFSQGQVDAVVVGADRVAANGDVANKIGTLTLAILAQRYQVPFYVAFPHSTLDQDCPSGDQIPIEHRAPEEVYGFRDNHWAARVPVFNPAFDVTPASLVTGWVTDEGMWQP